MTRAMVLLLTVMLLALQYRLWVGSGSLADVHRMQQHIASVRADIARTEARNAALEREIESLRSGESAALEARARRHLGLVREGEEFFVVVDGRQSQLGP